MTWTGPTPAGIAVLTAAATLVAACTGPAIDRSAPTPGSVAVSRSVVAHNSADEVFTLEMIRCHQQAIQMSEILLAKQDVDTRVVQLARQIQSMQTVELQHMLSWLRQWEIPVSTPRDGCSQPGVNNGDELQIAEGRTAGTVYLNQMTNIIEGLSHWRTERSEMASFVRPWRWPRRSPRSNRSRSTPWPRC